MTALTLSSATDTDDLAQALASIARPGVTVLLDGPVGAGKTTLARAAIHHLMHLHETPIEAVPSPTFTLVQSYQVGELEIWHADLYRLTSVDELLELGLEEAFETAFCLIEWTDRMGDLAPEDALRVELALDPANPDVRHAQIAGPASLVDTWLDQYQAQAA
ncbi:tRNA threonylcarbamoyladenosine biosynthesis protein TsaE [Litoreibacter ponti]|uniref:tRNA threonylcarbamoyladenosine biosynthesis protein TsaE n=1 Tax=Litoreibacter ponti TaxID=1510457 RepID=A0A2T6BPU0_9RHOB|nr:tRNA (adenosine(37)-N6)-threonylcarbamoyltransferase complex ATPase subunit type 1 TsaE [Litoreibacter ponti]PTX58105.1 tRNA threonylcarbamoyladenosine biosynthesis protein TsaE [Litoreibacter ponti]